MPASRVDLDTPVAMLRELGEELNALHRTAQSALASRREGAAERLRVDSEMLRGWYHSKGESVDRRLRALEEYLAARPRARLDFGYIQQRLRDRWSETWHAWTEWCANGQDSALQRMVTGLDCAMLEVSFINIPITVRENLASRRVGQVVDVYAEFKDQDGIREHVTEVLTWMQDHPETTPGIVDAPRGLIIAADRSPGRRLLTMAFVAAVVGVCALLAALRHPLGLQDLLGPEVVRDGQLVTAYAWALAGAFLHVLIAAAKELRAADTAAGEAPRSQPSLGNWFLWAHVRYLQIAAAAVWAFVVAMVAVQTSEGVEILTLLAAGYAADSLIDLALPKVTALMARRSEVVAKALA